MYRLLLMMVLLSGTWLPATESKPNVVIIVADDLGWGDVGFHGSSLQTPRLDRLAAEGLLCEQFYAYPLCSPTRIGLLTGRSPIRCGVVAALGPRSVGLPLSERVMSQAFKQAGYATWMIGKWHVGESTKNYLPNQRGFDHSYGPYGGGIDHFKHIGDKGGHADWYRNGLPVVEDGYDSDLYAQEVVTLLNKRKKEQPFFLYLSFNAPHLPNQAPQSYLDRYPTITDPEKKAYAGMVSAMDTAIGTVLDTLHQQQLSDKTIVLFMSDNGAPTEGAGSNGLLAGGKGGISEGGVRLPAIIRYLGVIPSGKKHTQMLTVLDVFPTLAAAVNIPCGNTEVFDGRDRWLALRDEKIIAPQPFVVMNQRQMAVIDYPWKIITPTAERGRQRPQLFDLSSDPSESKDVSADHADIMDRLTRLGKALAATAPEQTQPQPKRP